MALALDRRLVAVMFTDMVGYTALLQADERLALEQRERYWDALERHHQAFGGTIVQRLGDGSMSMFPSSLAAVQAAVATQQELAAHEVLARIGVHAGEVVVEPERLTGDAVNVAARIESFAVGGCRPRLGRGLRADQEPDRCRASSRWAGSGSRTSGARSSSTPSRPTALVVPDPRALEGKGERFASLPSNLPTPSAPLVGRADEVAALAEPRAGASGRHDHRTGGVGKTRVLVELGTRPRDRVPRCRRLRPAGRWLEPSALRARSRERPRRQGGRGENARRRHRLR